MKSLAPCACGRPAFTLYHNKPLCLRCLLVLRKLVALVAELNAKEQTERVTG